MTEIAIKLLEFIRNCRQYEVTELNKAIEKLKEIDKKEKVKLEGKG